MTCLSKMRDMRLKQQSRKNLLISDILSKRKGDLRKSQKLERQRKEKVATYLKHISFLRQKLLSKVLSYFYDYLCNIWTQTHSKLAFTVKKMVEVSLPLIINTWKMPWTSQEILHWTLRYLCNHKASLI